MIVIICFECIIEEEDGECMFISVEKSDNSISKERERKKKKEKKRESEQMRLPCQYYKMYS